MDRLPGQGAIRDYLAEVRDKVSCWLFDRGEDGLLAPDEVFHAEGMSHLDRALYVLRHTQQTVGELSRPAWR